MSAGSFTRSRYEDDDGNVHPIRVQPETLTASFGGTANAAPTGAITDDISAKVSLGTRQFGLRPRLVTVTFGENPPDGYRTNAYIRIPILRKTVYDGISYGDTLTYLGSSATVAGKSDERIR